MFRRWIAVTLFSLALAGAASAQDLAHGPAGAIVVLDHAGKIAYQRPGWQQKQPIVAGGQLLPGDAVFPQTGSLTVLCPDGEVKRLRKTQMSNGSPIACPPTEDYAVVVQDDLWRIKPTRGGAEDPNIPYLISPRATLIRTPELVLTWNPVLDVSSYELTLRADGSTLWKSGRLEETGVLRADGLTASMRVPGDVTLQPDVAYTVEICVRFTDARRACTTDPGWSSGGDEAFYYQPFAGFDELEGDVQDRLDAADPAALYARAVLLSTPRYQPPGAGAMLGDYAEAIQLLERILAEHPDSELARSPVLHTRLGRLYLRVNLPRSAGRAFTQAYDLAQDLQPANLDTTVSTLFGLATTASREEESLAYYNEAVASSRLLWEEDAFAAEFAGLCRAMGAVCLALDFCQVQGIDCQTWMDDETETGSSAAAEDDDDIAGAGSKTGGVALAQSTSDGGDDVSGSSSSQPAQVEVFTINNEGPGTICSVAVAAPGDSSTEQVVAVAPLAPGETAPLLELAPGVYSIRFLDCDGRELAAYPDADLALTGVLWHSPDVNTIAVFQQAFNLRADGQLEAALEVFAHDLQMNAQLGDYQSVIIDLTYIGQLHTRLGQFAATQGQTPDDHYAAARAALEQARTLAQAHQLPRQEAYVLQKWGELALATEDFAAALPNWSAAADLCRQAADLVCLATVLEDLADKHRDRGQNAEAENVYRQLADAAAESDTQESLSIRARALQSLAALRSHGNDPAAAADLYAEARSLYSQAGDRSGELNLLLTICIDRRHDRPNSLAACRDAIVLTENAQSESDLQIYLAALQVLGDDAREQGEYAAALGYVEQMQAARSSPYFNERLVTDAFYALAGDTYETQGRFAKALTVYEEARSFFTAQSDPQALVHILVQLGDLNYRLVRYDRAADYYQEAYNQYAILGDQGAQAQMQINLGNTAYYQEDYAGARNAYQAALALYKAGAAAGVETVWDQLLMWKYTADAYVAEDDVTGAVDALEHMHELAGSSLSEQYLLVSTQADVALAAGSAADARAAVEQFIEQAAGGDAEAEAVRLAARTTLANVLLQQGDLAAARTLLEELIPAVAAIDGEASANYLRMSLGYTYQALAMPQEARAAYEAVMQHNERILTNAGYGAAVLAMLNDPTITSPYRALAGLLAQQGDPATAFHYVERGRGLLARLELRSGLVEFGGGLVGDALAQEQEILLQQASNAQRDYDAALAANALIPAMRQARAALDEARAALAEHQELLEASGGAAIPLQFEPATLAEIQAVLPQRAALITYSLQRTSNVPGDLHISTAFVVTHDQIRSVPLTATIEALAEADLLAEAIGAPTRLRALYDALIAPLIGDVPPESEQIIIVPDGPLNNIPFVALQAPDGSYLIDHYAVSVASSGSYLVMLAQRAAGSPAPHTPGLVLAQPEAPGLTLLQAARTEARAVAQVLGVTPNLDAAESDLKAGAGGAAVIYVSAHAELDPLAPLFSAMQLGAGEKDDGRLEVREAYDLDLAHGTKLVVLSGCNTATGGSGESFGVMARAFLTAGAPRVIASLWAVDDAATADLMAAFMQARTGAANDAVALRSAMLQTRVQHPDLRHWASFVLNGLP